MSVDLLNAAEPDATLAPDAAVFATRAARFTQLANGHALGPWLAFLGQLSLAQSQLSQLPSAPPVAAQQPVWPAEMRTLPAEWPRVLHQLGALLSQDAPPPVRAAIEALASASPAQLHALAEQVLADARGQGGAPSASDAAERLLVAAALQACWTHWARQTPVKLAASASHCSATTISPIQACMSCSTGRE